MELNIPNFSFLSWSLASGEAVLCSLSYAVGEVVKTLWVTSVWCLSSIGSPTSCWTNRKEKCVRIQLCKPHYIWIWKKVWKNTRIWKKPETTYKNCGMQASDWLIQNMCGIKVKKNLKALIKTSLNDLKYSLTRNFLSWVSTDIQTVLMEEVVFLNRPWFFMDFIDLKI